MTPIDLSRAPLLHLVEEIRSRCFCSLIAVQLRESSPEADLRIFPHAEAKHSLDLLGLADLAHDDTRMAVRHCLIGPPDNPDRSMPGA